MPHHLVRAAALAIASAVAGNAGAEGLFTVKTIPNTMAIEAAKGAVDACAGRGMSVSATVVTRDGVARLIMAGDGAGPIATETSRRKAYTAAVIGIPTKDFIEVVKTLPGGTFPPPIDPNIIIMAGGLPIKADGVVIGGIGVGGAEAPNDEQCAAAGIARIADRLK